MRQTGSTDVAAMLAYYTPGLEHLAKRKNATDVFLRIVHKIDYPMPPSATGMRRGLSEEPASRTAYNERVGKSWRPVPHDQPFIVPHPSIPWATCSPDDLIEDGVLEMKTTNAWDLKNWGRPMTDEIPQIYIPQCAWLLACTNTSKAHVWLTIGKDLKDENKKPIFAVTEPRRLYIYNRDLEFEQMLIDAAGRFQAEHIETRIPPPMAPVKNRRKFKKLMKSTEEAAHV